MQQTEQVVVVQLLEIVVIVMVYQSNQSCSESQSKIEGLDLSQNHCQMVGSQNHEVVVVYKQSQIQNQNQMVLVVVIVEVFLVDLEWFWAHFENLDHHHHLCPPNSQKV